jgi:hypothetical protein
MTKVLKKLGIERMSGGDEGDGGGNRTMDQQC